MACCIVSHGHAFSISCRYDMARVGVAISDRPAGAYRYLRSFRPHGQQSRDLTLYKVRTTFWTTFECAKPLWCPPLHKRCCRSTPHGQYHIMLYPQDEDRAAYVVYSSNGNKDLHIGRLSRGYTDVIGGYKNAIVGASREGPAVFRHGERYYMVTSGCTGWDPNKALVHTAR